MQLEWNKWLTGVTSFKEGHGMLWIFCLVLFVAMWRKRDGRQRKLLIFSALTCFLILCPITAAVLLKGYTPFYDWFDLQLLLLTYTYCRPVGYGL